MTDPVPPPRADHAAPPRFSFGRMIPLGVLALGFVLFFVLGLDRHVSLESFRVHFVQLKDWVAMKGWLAPLLFGLFYALIVAFSVPGGLVTTLAGAMLFGWALNAAVVVAAATMGATALFLAARLGLGEPLRARAGPRLAKMEAGFNRDAFSYLLALRLVPLFPFWLVNLAPAFLGVRLSTYVLATAIGIAPATVIFSIIGESLGGLVAQGGHVSIEHVLTPRVAAALGGLAVLALLPVVYRRWRGGNGSGG
ncbi:MAG: TVP38/TMEM64 family protein [Alphaproteobacteria bacterium]|nr:TVP38/TMEM64 family protein [Alphaproteobacteria bacterium]